MADERKAKLFRSGGRQAVPLPAELRFEGDEVYITRDEAAGDVVLSERPRRETWRAFIAPDDADGYMAERPMNRPVGGRGAYADER